MIEIFEEIRFGIQTPIYPFDAIVNLAVYCEKAGFDSISVPDHTVYLPPRIDALEAWTTLAALAMRTKRVKLASIVSDPFRHHPSSLAQMVATLDIISNGRAILGIGAGEAMNLDPFGIKWDRPVSKMVEAVRIIRRLWMESPERIDYEGKFYKLYKACLLKPLQTPHPPIWIGGNSERTMKIVGELADGWVPLILPPESYAEYLEKIRGHANQLGRDPLEIEPALFIYFAVAKDSDTARSLIESSAKILILMAPPMTQKLIGYEGPQEFTITKGLFSDPAVVKKIVEASRDVPFEVAERGFLWGSPDKCIEMIEEYVENGVRWFIMRPLVPAEMEKRTVQLFAEKVLPYFREGTK